MITTTQKRSSHIIFFFVLIAIASLSDAITSHRAAFFLFAPLERIQNDFLALTRRATARHILLPKSDDAALALKQKIRNKSQDRYIVDVFEEAARRFSLDEDTASRGGLLGEEDTPTPQGYVRCPELDEARFTVPLGYVAGPIESQYGYHLVLVSERTNCPKLDGGVTRIIPGSEGGRAITIGPPEGESSSTDKWIELASGQAIFWVGTIFAGGVVAELAASAASVLENTVPKL